MNGQNWPGIVVLVLVILIALRVFAII